MPEPRTRRPNLSRIFSVINYDSRVLGRSGVIDVTMAGDPAAMAAGLVAYRSLLAALQFSSGQTYAEFRSGDQVAKYGLTALITGGAVVAAAKSWKLFAALGAAIIAVVTAIVRAVRSTLTKIARAIRSPSHPQPAPLGAASASATAESQTSGDSGASTASQSRDIHRCPNCGKLNRLSHVSAGLKTV